ncbi:amidase [Prosthecomicrobium pneumaticum]|uniref:Asp-tRNA(Asn)/Glu-tRNA(Gln) amidotransferase A subunit family amidase n=1 Tax=Prosthecomicrobium pneumaticum TaxID=81895 RepID=A0A7W9FJG6_9HYPH|nr:amidase [Prosthecomicrobium pneumaticum]MBB5751556.1 Asp-tRNA(Asn)/Glu-tRNA(Gln) amidotransferase A subunit family amidase [Prosthecomicrobium pneumaticum]
MKAPADLGAAEGLARIREGSLTAVAWTAACLDRIATEEPRIRAFAALDPEGALGRARAVDRGTVPPGRLAGLPIAVKDIIDVEGQPTGFGSDLPIGAVAARDAGIVALLRAAGAIPLGKTETVEFAALGRIPPTRNPRDPGRTPGGSSSGSAAAVAAGMVPLALGTQTGGSLVRPAAFTGVHALKPSHGLVSLDGVHPHAPSLDCVGWHARSVDDLALLAEVCGFPPAAARPARRLRIAACRSPAWSAAAPDMRAAFEAALGTLRQAGVEIVDLDLPPDFDTLGETQLVLMRAEAQVSFAPWRRRWGAHMHPDLAAILTEEARIPPARRAAAQAHAALCRIAFAEIMAGVDAVLAPAAIGEAPPFGTGTGSPAMNRMWTVLQVPIVALPIGRGAAGLPLGGQLVGPLYGDRDLLAIAGRVATILGAPAEAADGTA